jgi:hypothetical protein
LAGVGHRKQAEAAGQDRRTCCTLDHAPSDHRTTGVGQRDQDAGDNEQRQAELEDPLPTEHIAQSPARSPKHPSSDGSARTEHARGVGKIEASQRVHLRTFEGIAYIEIRK